MGLPGKTGKRSKSRTKSHTLSARIPSASPQCLVPSFVYSGNHDFLLTWFAGRSYGLVTTSGEPQLFRPLGLARKHTTRRGNHTIRCDSRTIRRGTDRDEVCPNADCQTKPVRSAIRVRP